MNCYEINSTSLINGFRLITPVNIQPEESFEYFCNNCGQFRLTANFKPKCCTQCKSENIAVGRIGSLDKAALKIEFSYKTEDFS